MPDVLDSGPGRDAGFESFDDAFDFETGHGGLEIFIPKA